MYIHMYEMFSFFFPSIFIPLIHFTLEKYTQYIKLHDEFLRIFASKKVKNKENSSFIY